MVDDQDRKEEFQEFVDRNRDWLEADPPEKQSTDDYPDVPFLAFEGPEAPDPQELQDQVERDALNEWIEYSPSEIEAALKRQAAARKDAGKRCERAESWGDRRAARIELRNWFVHNFRMRALQMLLQHVKFFGPKILEELKRTRPWDNGQPAHGLPPWDYRWDQHRKRTWAFETIRRQHMRKEIDLRSQREFVEAASSLMNEQDRDDPGRTSEKPHTKKAVQQHLRRRFRPDNTEGQLPLEEYFQRIKAEAEKLFNGG